MESRRAASSTAADGDLVAAHWRASGTNSVAAAGLPGKGGRADVDGRIAEEWSVIDIAAMLRQVGSGK